MCNKDDIDIATMHVYARHVRGGRRAVLTCVIKKKALDRGSTNGYMQYVE